VKVTVLSVGRLRPPFADDVAHYAKLLSRYCALELIELRDGERLARRIDPRAHLVTLDAGGTAYGSTAFAAWLEARRQSGRDLCFVLGGAFGHAPGVAEPAERLSFGPATLPHQLARVVLLEQLYRAHKILLNEPYSH
jgi:23S rRNA (pseudouridine1915-N3)-methyltransferase